MKVLVISKMFPDESNPINGIFIKEQIDGMPEDFEFRVISPRNLFASYLINKYIYRIPNVTMQTKRIWSYAPNIKVHYSFLPYVVLLKPLYGLLFTISIIITFRKIRKDFNPDVIHAHTSYPDGFAASILGRLIKKPVVITEHTGPFEMLLRYFFERWQTHYALRNCDSIITVSAFLKKRIAEEEIEENKITVIPNGFNPLNFHLSMNKSTHRNRILFVGFLVEVKGLGYLLDAVKIIRERNKDIKLEIVGVGPLEKSLKEIVGKLGIEENVTFYGFRPREEIARFINETDIVVLPSIYETFGVVIIEAMAMGRPVVATRCGGPEDIVTEDTGMLVPSRDSAALANAIMSIFNDYKKYNSQRISEIARERFSFDEVDKRIIEIYKRTCAV